MRRRLAVLIAAIMLVAAACGDDVDTDVGPGGEGTTTTAVESTTTTAPVGDSPAARLEEARARWAANGPSSYRLTLTEECFCPETVWIDTIVDGEVVAHEAGGDDTFYDPGPRTMDDLFAAVDDILADDYATLDLEFDDDTGALLHYWVDVSEMMADEEHGVRVEVGSVEEGTTPVDVDLTTLTEAWGCGHGFAAGNPDQTIAVQVHSLTGYGDPVAASPVTFPDEGWSAVVRVGDDLFANWCDDVIEPDEPTPAVDAEWTITGGTLTFLRPAGEELPDCDGSPVTATLTGLTVTGTDGEPVVLGDIDLSNDTWGCFAG